MKQKPMKKWILIIIIDSFCGIQLSLFPF